ncbi:hypothetical protein TNCV_5087571 [Trichonephila clavipes]|nr:hypothetical protein TNCV_5087571 [Trichonephila clavipes]
MSLLGSEISENLVRVAIWSMLWLGKTRPLPGHSSIGSIKTRTQLRSALNLSSGTPKRGTTSRLTGASSLLPPVYSEAWAKGNAEVSQGHQSPPYGRSVDQRIPRTPFSSSLRDAAHGKHEGRKTNGVSEKN